MAAGGGHRRIAVRAVHLGGAAGARERPGWPVHGSADRLAQGPRVHPCPGATAVAHSTLLHGDIPDAVGALTAQLDGVLAIMGSAVQIGSLMAADLTDERWQMIHQQLRGSGRRPIPEQAGVTPPLIDSVRTATGTLIATSELASPERTGAAPFALAHEPSTNPPQHGSRPARITEAQPRVAAPAGCRLAGLRRVNPWVSAIISRLDRSRGPGGSRVRVRRDETHPGATDHLVAPPRPPGLRHPALITNAADPTAPTVRPAPITTPGWRTRSRTPRPAGWPPSPAAASRPLRSGWSWGRWPRPGSAARPKRRRSPGLPVAGRLVRSRPRPIRPLDATGPWARDRDPASPRARPWPISPSAGPGPPDPIRARLPAAPIPRPGLLTACLGPSPLPPTGRAAARPASSAHTRASRHQHAGSQRAPENVRLVPGAPPPRASLSRTGSGNSR